MGLLCCACWLFSLSTGCVVARREPALDRPPPRLAVILPVKGSADRRGGPPLDRILLLDLPPDLPRRGHQAAAGRAAGHEQAGLIGAAPPIVLDPHRPGGQPPGPRRARPPPA